MAVNIKYRNRLYDRKLKQFSRANRKNSPPAEKKIWLEILRDFKQRVIRQKPLGKHIVDSYCAKLRLVIEIDGDSHFMPEGMEKDMSRKEYFKKIGLREIRFTNADNIEGVWEVLNGFAG